MKNATNPCKRQQHDCDLSETLEASCCDATAGQKQTQQDTDHDAAGENIWQQGMEARKHTDGKITCAAGIRT